MKKLTIEQVKKIHPETLMKLINKMKEFLKKNQIVIDMFKEYDIPIEELDLIPMKFGDLDVSARTDHGVITFSYKLLCDGNFFKDYMYAVHEITHFLQQTTGDKPTQGAEDGDYLENPFEQEGFQKQIEFVDDMYGSQEADDYVEHLLDHHDVKDSDEREEKKEKLMESIAQYTGLDKEQESRHHGYGYSYWDYPRTNPVLPFQDWHTKHQMEESKREEARERAEQLKEKEKVPLNLRFPQLGPEYFRYRGLSPEEIANLKKEDEEEMERRKTQYYGKPEERDIPPSQKFFDVEAKISPEEARAKMHEAYNRFRETAVKFYEYYKEANAIASHEYHLDYNKSYIDLIKSLPSFLVHNVRKQIGKLFGLVPEGREYRHSDRARRLIRFINNGLDIFNVTPLNVKEKLSELHTAEKNMKVIMEAYDKRRKVLDKLPDILEQAAKDYLRKKNNRDFLKWMDEYYPNEKSDFIHDSIKGALDAWAGSGRRKHDSDYLRLADLTRIKSYKNIYDKSHATMTELLPRSMQHKLIKDIKSGIRGEVKNKVESKFSELLNIVKNSGPQDMKTLFLYSNRVLRLDLKSMIDFGFMMIDKHAKETSMEEKASATKDAFITSFLKFLEKSLDIVNNQDSYKLNHLLDSVIHEMLERYVEQHPEEKHIETLKHREFSTLNVKDLDIEINDTMKRLIVNSLPNFGAFDYHRYSANSGLTDFPNLHALGEIVKKTGKFSVDSIMNYILADAPFLPRDFVLHLARTLFKGATTSESGKIIATLQDIKKLNEPESVFAMKVFLSILEKQGAGGKNSLNPNSFVSGFIEHFNTLKKIISKLRSSLSVKFKDPQILKIISLAIRNFSTITQDLNNLNTFIDFAHNDASNLNSRDLMIIFSNINFHSFTKIGIVRKVIKTYAEIRDNGGISGIQKEYGRVIREMMKGNYVHANFFDNIKLIWNFFSSNQEISPASELFQKLFEAASTFETDMKIITMAGTFKELLHKYEPKDNRLFNLNLNISDRLKFTVLKDRDPRMLQVGIETNCCQRIGGAGESAAKDSFINPLAGVLILEWKDDDGDWELLSQSYFHYVPPITEREEEEEETTASTGEKLKEEDKGGYILDNVEYNASNVRDSKINLEEAYNYLAEYAKDKLDVGFFLAGRGYSKISVHSFGEYSMDDGDPRSFKAVDRYRDRPYTDFDPYNSIDLLHPKFESKYPGAKTKEEIKQAFESNLRKIILYGNIAA